VFKFAVHCRIGSLENNRFPLVNDFGVHCRIGSLETAAVGIAVKLNCSLPYRQLRKVADAAQ